MTRGESSERVGRSGGALRVVHRSAVGWNELAEKLGELSKTLQGHEASTGRSGRSSRPRPTPCPASSRPASPPSAVRRRREVHTRASTGELARAVDQAQYDTGEGPCLTSLYDQQTVRLSDLSSETRWPEFTARTRRMGLRSMLAIQLYVTGEDLGALNLHSTRPDAFTDESEQVGLLFAAHAAVAMAGAQEQEHLRTAVNSRDLIGQAKGILRSATRSARRRRSGCSSWRARPPTSG